MTIACAGLLNNNFLVFPNNRGVSNGADRIEEQIEELQSEFDQSLTIGKHFKETRRIISEAIEKYAVENWDGYGAEVIDILSCVGAILFSQMLPDNLPLPEIYVDPDGEITFEWYLKPRKVFSVTVRRNEELSYAGLFGVNKFNGTAFLDDELPDIILNSIARVLS
jgi:hypothetical protein